MLALAYFPKCYQGISSFLSFLQSEVSITKNEDDQIIRKDFGVAYRCYCMQNNLSQASITDFISHLMQLGITRKTIEVDDELRYVFCGLIWKDNKRYYDDEDSDLNGGINSLVLPQNKPLCRRKGQDSFSLFCQSNVLFTLKEDHCITLEDLKKDYYEFCYKYHVKKFSPVFMKRYMVNANVKCIDLEHIGGQECSVFLGVHLLKNAVNDDHKKEPVQINKTEMPSVETLKQIQVHNEDNEPMLINKSGASPLETKNAVSAVSGNPVNSNNEKPVHCKKARISHLETENTMSTLNLVLDNKLNSEGLVLKDFSIRIERYPDVNKESIPTKRTLLHADKLSCHYSSDRSEKYVETGKCTKNKYSPESNSIRNICIDKKSSVHTEHDDTECFGKIDLRDTDNIRENSTTECDIVGINGADDLVSLGESSTKDFTESDICENNSVNSEQSNASSSVIDVSNASESSVSANDCELYSYKLGTFRPHRWVAGVRLENMKLLKDGSYSRIDTKNHEKSGTKPAIRTEKVNQDMHSLEIQDGLNCDRHIDSKCNQPSTQKENSEDSAISSSDSETDENSMFPRMHSTKNICSTINGEHMDDNTKSYEKKKGSPKNVLKRQRYDDIAENNSSFRSDNDNDNSGFCKENSLSSLSGHSALVKVPCDGKRIRAEQSDVYCLTIDQNGRELDFAYMMYYLREKGRPLRLVSGVLVRDIRCYPQYQSRLNFYKDDFGNWILTRPTFTYKGLESFRKFIECNVCFTGKPHNLIMRQDFYKMYLRFCTNSSFPKASLEDVEHHLNVIGIRNHCMFIHSTSPEVAFCGLSWKHNSLLDEMGKNHYNVIIHDYSI